MTDTDLHNIDSWRGPTAMSVAVGVSAEQDQRAVDAALRSFA